MFRFPTLIHLILIFCLSSCFQNSNEFLKLGDAALESGDKIKARELYLKAAEMNNAVAHFNIAYKFINTHEESVFHFSEAAKLGHEESLENILDILFFRANSLSNANPEEAYQIYIIAKEVNSTLNIYDEENKITLLRMCLEAGPFDAVSFMEEYDIREDEFNNEYEIWELAAEASRGGRFGKPNTKLALQLISRGSSVPFELESALNDAYKHYRAGMSFDFSVCNYVSSGQGISYCAAQSAKVAKTNDSERLKNLNTQLKEGAQELLLNAFNEASIFIEEKARKEEFHDGSGYQGWIITSITQQKTAYLDLIEQINESRFDEITNYTENPDKILNETYQILMDKLSNSPILGMNAELNASGLRAVQRHWIKHRDSSALLFEQLDPSVSSQQWTEWLTIARVSELKEVLQMVEEYSYLK